MSAPASRWITCPVPRPGARFRLLCHPYGGSGASVFRSWASQMAAEIELLAIQPPGRETRQDEPPATDLLAYAEALATEARPFLDRPYALFGHSLGGMVAFELTRALRRRGEPLPVRLFVSACLPRNARSRLVPPLGQLPEEDFIRVMADLYGTPAVVFGEPQTRARVLPALRADAQMVEGYPDVPEPPLPVPISAFAGTEDRAMVPEELEWWRKHTTAGLVKRILPGRHLFLLTSREEICQAIAADLGLTGGSD